MKRSREERSIEERVLNLEISNLYRSLTSRLIEIYDEQRSRKPEPSNKLFDVHVAAAPYLIHLYPFGATMSSLTIKTSRDRLSLLMP